MSVYNDMANDAGYEYDTEENQQMADMLEAQERQEYFDWAKQEEEEIMAQTIIEDLRKDNDHLKETITYIQKKLTELIIKNTNDLIVLPLLDLKINIIEKEKERYNNENI